VGDGLDTLQGGGAVYDGHDEDSRGIEPKKLILTRHNKLKMIQRNKLINAQPKKLI
jgi:hypothetical protein